MLHSVVVAYCTKWGETMGGRYAVMLPRDDETWEHRCSSSKWSGRVESISLFKGAGSAKR
jgi:hypothetical protein